MATPSKPYGNGDNVFAPKADSGIVDQDPTTTHEGPRKKSGIGPR
jgi:hypothetical protein